MRHAAMSIPLVFVLLFVGDASHGFGAGTAKKPLFDTSGFRPVIALNETPVTTPKAVVTISGVVFSRATIDKVTIGDRTASTRPAEPKDLMKLQAIPDGAPDAPSRTYFEIRDVSLSRFGANDLELRAVDNDGRISDLHRITIVRVLNVPAESGK